MSTLWEFSERGTASRRIRRYECRTLRSHQNFIARWWREPKEKLNPETQLSNDLGIYGGDGVELIAAFCEEFDIQNTSKIDLTEHFAPEGCDLLGLFFFSFGIYVFLYYLFFDREKLREEPEGITPLTLRDLVKSAEAKRWIPPEA